MVGLFLGLSNICNCGKTGLRGKGDRQMAFFPRTHPESNNLSDGVVTATFLPYSTAPSIRIDISSSSNRSVKYGVEKWNAYGGHKQETHYQYCWLISDECFTVVYTYGWMSYDAILYRSMTIS